MGELEGLYGESVAVCAKSNWGEISVEIGFFRVQRQVWWSYPFLLSVLWPVGHCGRRHH